MKRIAICSLAVMLAASVANAGPNPNLWLSNSNGGTDGIYDLAPSETAVIQLWIEILPFTAPAVALENVDAILAGYDALWGDTVNFEVQGFNDIAYTEPDWYRLTRGDVTAELPNGDIDHYQYVGQTDPPWTAATGWQGPATVLLDEIVIHCLGYSPDLDGDGIQDPDMVFFGFDIYAPGGFQLFWRATPPPAGWNVSEVGITLLNGTYGNPFEVLNPIPEPATLGLLVLGGLAAFRRR